MAEAAPAKTRGKTKVSEQTAALIEQLKHRLWQQRRDAAYRLERLKDPAAVEALVEALSDESYYVRLAAARALGKIGDAGAVDALVAMLENEDEAPVARWTALWALGEIGPGARSALPVLQKYLANTSSLPENPLTVKDLAEVVIALVDREPALPVAEGEAESGGKLTPEERRAKREAALARKRGEAPPAAEAPAPAAGESGGKLTPEERRAKREAALARKHAAASGEAPPPAAETPAAPASEESGGKLTPEERRAKREAALARKRAREQGEG
ncbi:MAG: hypothetical protein Kow00124_14670 [Anaerolineae bacterium]